MPSEPAVLSDRDKAVLDAERRWRVDRAPKSAMVREQLAMSPARYYRSLARLVQDPAAMRYDPLLVKRLRREHDGRRRARYEGAAARGSRAR